MVRKGSSVRVRHWASRSRLQTDGFLFARFQFDVVRGRPSAGFLAHFCPIGLAQQSVDAGGGRGLAALNDLGVDAEREPGIGVADLLPRGVAAACTVRRWDGEPRTPAVACRRLSAAARSLVDLLIYGGDATA